MDAAASVGSACEEGPSSPRHAERLAGQKAGKMPPSATRFTQEMAFIVTFLIEPNCSQGPTLERLTHERGQRAACFFSRASCSYRRGLGAAGLLGVHTLD